MLPGVIAWVSLGGTDTTSSEEAERKLSYHLFHIRKWA